MRIAKAKGTRGDAVRLAAAFGLQDWEKVEAVLRNPDYVLAMKRHRALAAALGIPEFAVGMGYNHAAAGDLPPDVAEGTYAPA